MQIRIPHATRQEEVQALKNAIERACVDSGVDEYTATMWLTRFLEAAADELTKGRVLSIPGFGLFVPYVLPPSRRGSATPVPPLCTVRFSAARPLRNQVRYGTPNEANNGRYIKHCRNHHPSSDPKKENQRVFTAMKGMRDRISAQLSHARART